MKLKDDKADTANKQTKVGQNDNKQSTQTCHACRSSYQNSKPGLCGDCTFKIYENKTISSINTIYGALDGFNTGSSAISACYQAFYINSKLMANYYHDDLLTIPGIIAATVTTIAFIGMSIIANRTEEPNKFKTAIAPLLDSQNRRTQKEENQQKKYIDFLWRLIRGIIKSFKNWLKAYRTIAATVILAGLTETNILTLPLGIGIGVAFGISAVAVRLWTLHMQEDRKNLKKNNEDALSKLLSIANEELVRKVLTQDQWNQFLKSREVKLEDIKNQSDRTKLKGKLAAAYSGFLNTAYLYMGLLVVLSSVVTWPIYIAMTAFCVLYSILHVAAAMWEEDEFERDLDITEARAQLAWHSNEILKALNEKQTPDSGNIAKFIETRDRLNKLLTLSPKATVLAGIFNGLAVHRAYLALVTFILLISPAVAAAAPAFLIVSVSIGLLFLTVFTLHAVRFYANQRAQRAKETIDNVAFLSKECTTQEEREENIKQFSAIIKKETSKKPDQLFVKDGAEFLRLMPASASKGWKGVNFPGNPAMELGADGNYHETPAMSIIMIISAVFQGIVIPLRYLFKSRKGDNKKPKPVAAEAEVKAEGDTNNPQNVTSINTSTAKNLPATPVVGSTPVTKHLTLSVSTLDSLYSLDSLPRDSDSDVSDSGSWVSCQPDPDFHFPWPANPPSQSPSSSAASTPKAPPRYSDRPLSPESSSSTSPSPSPSPFPTPTPTPPLSPMKLPPASKQVVPQTKHHTLSIFKKPLACPKLNFDANKTPTALDTLDTLDTLEDTLKRPDSPESPDTTDSSAPDDVPQTTLHITIDAATIRRRVSSRTTSAFFPSIIIAGPLSNASPPPPQLAT